MSNLQPRPRADTMPATVPAFTPVASHSLLQIHAVSSSPQLRSRSPVPRRRKRDNVVQKWSTTNTARLHQLINKCQKYSVIYGMRAAAEKYWVDALNILSGILGGLISTIGILGSAISGDSNEQPLWSKIIQIILGFGVIIISTLAANWQPSNMYSEYRQVCDILSFIRGGMIEMCAMDECDRPNAVDYIKSCASAINGAIGSEPQPQKYIDAYLDSIKNGSIDDDLVESESESESSNSSAELTNVINVRRKKIIPRILIDQSNVSNV